MTDETTDRLKRRRLVLRLGAVAPLAALAACVPESGPAYYAPVRRQVTDSDPRDGAGQGRGYSAPPPRRQVTDSDPRDGAGQGRGYSSGPVRGTTDSDPRDSAGRGRGGTGRSDSDPRDAPGRGRGW